MLTKEQPSLKGTAGSHTIISNGLRTRVRPHDFWCLWLLPDLPMPEIPRSQMPQPVQSQGESLPSRHLSDYLLNALADRRGSVSELPTQIRITSTPETGAFQMDPWEAKNGRRIRLIEKKHREGLDAKEATELARLKCEVYDHIQAVAPRSTEVLDEIEVRIGKLKRKAEAKRGKKA